MVVVWVVWGLLVLLGLEVVELVGEVLDGVVVGGDRWFVWL